MFELGFILLPTIEDIIFQKQNIKRYALIIFGYSSLKIVFVLLTKVVIFYVQITIIKIRVLGL